MFALLRRRRQASLFEFGCRVGRELADVVAVSLTRETLELAKPKDEHDWRIVRADRDMARGAIVSWPFEAES